MKGTETVCFGTVNLEVVGSYDPGERGDGYLQPPLSPSFEINKVLLDGVDVIDLICEIDSEFLTKIEEQILNQR